MDISPLSMLALSVGKAASRVPMEQLKWSVTFAGMVLTKGSGGAGLGLSIVLGIVEAHGGRIWVESGLGEGSSFTFILPKTPATAAVGSAGGDG